MLLGSSLLVELGKLIEDRLYLDHSFSVRLALLENLNSDKFFCLI